jgi:SAM-dependent methyltransferase
MTVHPKLAGRSCYHKYEVEPGLFTPGRNIELEPKLCLDELGVPQSLFGLRALDIGAWDGPLTFELERRGAQVIALDIQDPDITLFNAVKEIKNSSAAYVRGSVYDALPETLGVYDVVLFAGVYYHLKNPVLALQRIRRLLIDGGALFIEGASSTEYLAEQLNEALQLPKSRVPTTVEILDRLPLSYFDAEHKIYPHWSNWWFPTTRGLEVILLDSGFRNVACKLKRNAFCNYSHRRLMGRAEADPAKSNPGEQKYEHSVYEHSVSSELPELVPSFSRRLLSWLPPGLQRVAKRGRRAVRRGWF